MVYSLFLSAFLLFGDVSEHHALPPVVTEIELLQLTTSAGQPYCLSGCFATEVAAHWAASKWLLQAALSTRREVGWRVYRLSDNTYTHSYPGAGEREATQSRLPKIASGLEYISSGHIHWDQVHEFSPQDWNWVAGNRKPLFLMSNEGVLRRALPQRVRRLGRSGGLATRAAVGFPGESVAEPVPANRSLPATALIAYQAPAI